MLQLETEISLLKSKNLIGLIPNHLFNYFKIDYNERILSELLSSLNKIIENQDLSLVEVSLSTLNSFEIYHKSIKENISVFDKQKHLCNLINLPTNEELLSYQRSIFIQFFDIKHYDLVYLLFQKVFDIYNAANNNNTSNDDESMAEGLI